MSHQVGKRRNVGVGLVGHGALFATKNDTRVMGIRVGQDAVALRPENLDQRGAFVQSISDLAVIGDGGVFDNDDARGSAFNNVGQSGRRTPRLQGGGLGLVIAGDW